jgi:hypothetical protein
MPNERLRRAIHEAGLRLDDVARHVGIDTKTAERWITKDRIPHPVNRALTAQLLGVEEAALWPQLAEESGRRATTAAELVAIYADRGAVPRNRWYELLDSARERVDVLVYAGLFLPDGRADLPALVRRKAEDGVRVRLLYGDPDCAAVAVRGAEEGIGDGLSARIRIAMAYMLPVFDVPGVEARSHTTTLYNSIYRFDDELLVNAHAYGFGAPQAPVLHLRRISGGPLFDFYTASFERVWQQGTPISAKRDERVVT